MGFHRGRDVADITVRNPDLAGLALRDLRLPFDSVIMAVRRRGTLLVPHAVYPAGIRRPDHGHGHHSRPEGNCPAF